MATLYVVPNWEKDFETPRSREIAAATYFVVGNTFDGRRMRRLQRLDQSLTLYGAFHVILAIASKTRYRGVLLDDRGPMGSIDIAEKSGFLDDVGLFKDALEKLSDPTIALLEKHDIEQSDDGSWPLPEAVKRWAVSADDRRKSRAATRVRKEPQADAGDRERPPHAKKEVSPSKAPAPRPLATASDREPPQADARAVYSTYSTVHTEVPSAVSLEGRPPAAPESFIVNGRITLPADHGGRNAAINFAKAVICQKILGGKDPGRPWSRDAMDRLTSLLESGLPLVEVDRIAWWRTLPKADDVPELKKRFEPITETGLMNYWGDELSRANDYWKKTRAANGSGKKEPAKWRDFFKWQYGPEITLPASWAELDQDQRDEYDRGFQTFEQAMSRLEVAR